MNKTERDKLRELAMLPKSTHLIHVWAEDMIALLDQIDALEGLIANLAAPTYSDEKVFALARWLKQANPNWAAEQLHAFALRAKAAIASASEVK